MQSLFPSLMLGGLGGLGVWSFSKKIDDAEMRADDAFFNVKDNVERRFGVIMIRSEIKIRISYMFWLQLL